MFWQWQLPILFLHTVMQPVGYLDTTVRTYSYLYIGALLCFFFYT
jgi:hypothetical protein